MTLSSSLNAGVAGLTVNSSKLGTISDNIANSQTSGYKRADTAFSSLVIPGSESRYSAGGVRAVTVRDIEGRGGIVTSSNPGDIAISGRGFFPIAPAGALDNVDGDIPAQFITTGSFRTDADGILRTATGQALLGWPADPDGTVPEFPRDTTDGLAPVRISTSDLARSPTTEIGLGVNLPAAATQAGALGTSIPLGIEYFDNVGASQTLNLTFTPTVPATGSSNEWTVTIEDSLTAAAANPVASFVVQFDDSAALGGSILAVPTTTGGAYDVTTGIFTFNVAGGPISMNLGQPGETSDGLSQLSAEFGPTAVTKNGAPVASLESFFIDENGFVQATFGGGFSRIIYQVPVANFPNNNGLTALDGQAFSPSALSGALFLWNAGDGPTGSVIGFALEESNADIAAELTALIETQRAYSSNATVIQTVDEMLQETTNIKR
ncbi:MAG: flagellar hook-basal body complex protein [Pseudomonadota bacterium]